MIQSNVKKVMSEIGSVKLVAVSKKKPVEDIKNAIDSGVKIIGENRIQEAELKYDKLKNVFKKNNIEFHFIGHLQTNKVKKAVEMFDLIQTVDSLKLTKEINKRAKEINKVQNILIEINIGKEPQKNGIDPDQIFDFIEKLKQFENINIKGLMCIHPFGEDPAPFFTKMKKIFEEIKGFQGNIPLIKNLKKFNTLSMGMSNDYLIAIKYGSNMIRVGTKIFGERI